MQVYNSETLANKNVLLSKDRRPPDKLEVLEDRIVVYSRDEILEIPINSMRAKALLDRLSYGGELTQEIYI
ncbi:MAG: pantothenate kinase [Acidobacteria bacterium]|jgi:hypothetical protein|nr:MAG: pantothenate kinase [Acidobacteriota bacterium]